MGWSPLPHSLRPRTQGYRTLTYRVLLSECEEPAPAKAGDLTSDSETGRAGSGGLHRRRWLRRPFRVRPFTPLAAPSLRGQEDKVGRLRQL